MYFTRKLFKSGGRSFEFAARMRLDWWSWSFVACRVVMTYTAMITFLTIPAAVQFLQKIEGIVDDLLGSSGLVVPKSLPPSTVSLASARAVEVLWIGERGRLAASTFFTTAEISHLLDVHQVMMWLVFLTGVAVGYSVLIEGKTVQITTSAQLRHVAQFIVVISFPVLAGFSHFFEAFHRILFPQGNYTFAPESVLIQCFPPVFWFVAVTVLQVSAVVLLWYQSRQAGGE